MKNSEQYVYNTILVHVSRTWERIRLESPTKELTFDEIESVDQIVRIADEILNIKIIQEYIQSDHQLDFFYNRTGKLSDDYITDKSYLLIRILLK